MENILILPYSVIYMSLVDYVIERSDVLTDVFNTDEQKQDYINKEINILNQHGFIKDLKIVLPKGTELTTCNDNIFYIKDLVSKLKGHCLIDDRLTNLYELANR